MPNRHRTTEELAFNTTVGNNIKYIRKIKNFTQSRVGKAIGTTFQQIQKYEKGANGVSALKLKKIAALFDLKTDVLIDPNFIPYHKGFTGKMDWVDKSSFDATKYEEFDDEYPPEAGGLEHDPKMQATYDAILEDK